MYKVQTIRPEEQIVDHSDMSTHSIEMPFESPLFHFNQFKELEYEKHVEEVVHVHEACNLDDDPLCLDELCIDDLDMWSKLNLLVRMHIWMMSPYFLMNYLRMSAIIVVRRHVLRILRLESP